MASRCLFSAAFVTALGAVLLPVESSADVTRAAPRPQPYFERNVGQAPSDVRFVMRGALRGAITTRGVVVVPPAGAPRLLRFTGARLEHVSPEQPLPGRAHYLIGDRRQWRQDIPTYGRVRAGEIYPGIDLLLYGAGEGFEYDLVIAPRADARRVSFVLDGAGAPRVREDGSIAWSLGGTELVQGRPVAYQDGPSGRRPVDVAYRVMKTGEVGFQIGEYDRDRALVIDPTLVFSGYVHGGNLSELVNDIAMDGSGNIYVAGMTQSTDLATTGAFDRTQSFDEGYITKLDPTGRTVIWSTYIGGNHHDTVLTIAVDGSANVYAAGHTISTDFPVTAGAYDTTHTCPPATAPCLRDAFVVKLSATGASLRYGTFIGGSAEDWFEDIGVDSAGRAHLAGVTGSPEYPTTAGAFVRLAPPGSNVVHTTLNASGTGLAYSTFLGGSDGDSHASVSVRSDGSRVVAFATSSTDVPTVRPVQPALNVTTFARYDAFVVSFGPTATALFATYLGGSGFEFPADVTIGPGGTIFVAADTTSADLPRQRSYGPVAFNDLLVVKLSADGQQIVYATRMGGSQHDASVDMVVDGYGRAILTGRTSSSDFPTTPDALKRVLAGGDAFLIVFSATGAPTYSTLFGGSQFEAAAAMARLGSNVLIGGHTNSTNFPVRNGLGPPPGMTTADGKGFLIKFAIEAPTAPPPPPPPATCSSRELVLHAIDATVHGGWQAFTDSTAASNTKVRHPNAGAARITTPLASPTHYVELRFFAEAGVPYRMWIRGRADANHWANDSVYVQFSDSVTSTGAATWRIGTTSATTYTLENCTGCQILGWGWNDNNYGGVNLGTPVQFAATGTHTIRLQTREDGLAIDQIVLSAARYFQEAPGTVRDDTTILPKCSPTAP